jgi:surface polysaccharide O-acyltransferase-like enzyme
MVLYVLLPILSSDYKKHRTTDIYMGGIAILTYKKHSNYKFGVYAGNEARFYITPL